MEHRRLHFYLMPKRVPTWLCLDCHGRWRRYDDVKSAPCEVTP